MKNLNLKKWKVNNRTATLLVVGLFLCLGVISAVAYNIEYETYIEQITEGNETVNITTTLTKITYEVNGTSYSHYIETEEQFNECKNTGNDELIVDGVVFMLCPEATYEEFIQRKIRENVESHEGSGAIEVDDIVAETVTAGEYLYASEGFNETLDIATYRNILHNMQLLPNGEINKSSYHPKLISNDRVRIGVVQNFIIYGLQLIDDVLVELHNRVTTLENKIQQIEDNGYTGTCPDGTKPNFNKGIAVGCV